MRTGSFVSIGCAAVLAAALAACGGGSGGALPAYGGSGTNPVSGQSSNFSNLSSTPLAVGDHRAFSPSESGYSGGFTATSSAPGVASVSPGSGTGPFMVSAVAPGTATITVTDGSGRTSSTTLTVGALGFGSLSSAPLSIGEQRSFTPTEPGYAGTFAVTSANPAIIAVSPASGTGPFTLTGVAPGTTTVTVADASGHSMPVTLTVAAASGSPTSAPSGSPTTAPSGSPTTGPTSTPTTGPTSTPTTGPTSTPTTGPTSTPTTAPTSAPTTGPTSTPTTAPTAAPTASPITLAPSSVGVGLNQIAQVQATDNRGGTLSSATVANPAIATIVPSGNGFYQIVGDQDGATTVTFTDSLGNTQTLPVTVSGSAPAININPSGLTGGSVGIGANVLTLMPTEAGYSGSFTATSSNSAIAQTVAVPLTNDFLVTTAAQGSTIITVRDTNGNSASLGLTVQ